MKIIIVGNGGHSAVVQEMIAAIGRYEVIAILDDTFKSGFKENGMMYAPISLLPYVLDDDVKVVVAVGDNQTRRNIVKRLNLKPEYYLTIIHPAAVVSGSATICDGTVVMPNAVINPNTHIGMHAIINTGAVVEHDCSVGDFAHISPNATLTGNVSVGDGTHIGSSANVIPGKHVGRWSIVGAGSTVIESIPAYSKAVGSPARIIARILLSS